MPDSMLIRFGKAGSAGKSFAKLALAVRRLRKSALGDTMYVSR